MSPTSPSAGGAAQSPARLLSGIGRGSSSSRFHRTLHETLSKSPPAGVGERSVVFFELTGHRAIAEAVTPSNVTVSWTLIADDVFCRIFFSYIGSKQRGGRQLQTSGDLDVGFLFGMCAV
ncbi:hypothetical protein EVAR_16880_1 [Eumeta japonica]|uniref:Uncharacterized protein n=1 Tax=Eumeta variegata TaxID=151549 RepID=A0A4C1V311_EUMVA|nr:hypothetical protein EVAR_16880_1 [Eumeta japonica]